MFHGYFGIPAAALSPALRTSRQTMESSKHPGRQMKCRRHRGATSIRRQTLLACLPLLLCCLLAVAWPADASGVKESHGGDQHRQIEQLEQQWRAALLGNDSTAMASMLADSYVGIGPDGTISSKGEELQARASGQQHLERLDIEDRKIRIYGATAVVTSKVRLQGVYSGQPLLGEYRYTRVWTLAHGQWHIVSFEANRVHDASARSR